MMIGPEQDKKASGKSGKKKAKAKKAKRRAAEREVDAPTSLAGAGTTPSASEPAVAADPEPRPEVAGAATPADATPDVGPELLTWIDRVQERVDHLLTLVDPAVATPVTVPDAGSVAAPDPAPTAVLVPESTSVSSASAPGSDGEEAPPAASAPEASASASEPSEPAPERSEPETSETPAPVAAPTPSLAEAWARRQQQETVVPAASASRDADRDDRDGEDENEPFEPVDARLTAVLVARELIARGESPTAVRRRLREGYGVVDPDAVLAQVAA